VRPTDHTCCPLAVKSLSKAPSGVVSYEDMAEVIIGSTSFSTTLCTNHWQSAVCPVKVALLTSMERTSDRAKAIESHFWTFGVLCIEVLRERPRHRRLCKGVKDAQSLNKTAATEETAIDGRPNTGAIGRPDQTRTVYHPSGTSSHCNSK
jgi:hypothetical protein